MALDNLKKIQSNFDGQTPSTGKEVEDAFNENFEAVKDEIVQLAGDTNVINDTLKKITKKSVNLADSKLFEAGYWSLAGNPVTTLNWIRLPFQFVPEGLKGRSVTISGATNVPTSGAKCVIKGVSGEVLMSLPGNGRETYPYTIPVPADADTWAFSIVNDPSDGGIGTRPNGNPFTNTFQIEEGTDATPFQVFGEVFIKVEKIKEPPSVYYVKYDKDAATFAIFQQSKKNTFRYFMLLIKLDQNDTDEVYKKIWRVYAGGYYEYVDGGFASLNRSIIYTGENEFAQRFVNKVDYTGGSHGDERIDSEGSFVRFFIDGVLIPDTQLENSFELECIDFKYVQYSTLHETADPDNVAGYVEGHPVIGRHLKTTDFIDGGYKTYNKVIFAVEETIYQWHSGLFCGGKDFSNKCILPDQTLNNLTGSGDYFISEFPGNEVNCYHDANKLSFKVTSRMISGIPDDSALFLTSIWDRMTDSKYYRRTSGNINVFPGDIIESEMIVTYKD